MSKYRWDIWLMRYVSKYRWDIWDIWVNIDIMRYLILKISTHQSAEGGRAPQCQCTVEQVCECSGIWAAW